jgi:hypothetical protein
MAFGSPDSLTINPIDYTFSLFSLIPFCGTGTDPATETKSSGLPADALLFLFFALHLDS